MSEVTIIVVYFLSMLAIGAWTKGKAREADEFFVAGRRSSQVAITGSLLSTIIGASATVGMAGLGFTRGLTGIWWLLVGSVGLVFLGIFFAGKVRSLALYTLPELIEKQYDRRVGLASSILIVVSWVGIIAAQIAAAGTILGILGIGSPLLWMVIFTAVFVAYTVIGGQHAVIDTDLVQTILIYVGIFGGVAVLMSRVGGWSALTSALPAGNFSFPVSPKFDTYALVSTLLLVGLTYVVGPDMYSRLFCAKDARVARNSAFWTAGLLVPISLAIVLFGMGAAVLFPKIAPEQAFPTVIKGVFSPLLGGLILAALVSAVMSSADKTLLSASTILMVDILGRGKTDENRTVGRSRWAIAILGLCSLGVALMLKGVISTLLFAYTVYTAGIILPVIFGFYRKRLNLTANGALVALIGGGTVGLISKLFTIKYLDVGALVISGVLLFAVSYIDNALKKSRG